jgi:hypothetical protein
MVGSCRGSRCYSAKTTHFKPPGSYTVQAQTIQ